MTPDYKEMVYNTQLLYYRVFSYKTFDTKLRLHGKAVEWAVLTEITVLKLKAHRVHLQ